MGNVFLKSQKKSKKNKAARITAQDRAVLDLKNARDKLKGSRANFASVVGAINQRPPPPNCCGTERRIALNLAVPAIPAKTKPIRWTASYYV